MKKIDISTAIDNRLKSVKDFWKNKFEGFSNYTTFNADDLSGKVCDYNVYSYILKEDISEKLIKASRQNDHQLHVLLLSGLFMCLKKYSQEDDLLTFTPVFNGSNDSNLMNNILSIRLFVKGDMTFKNLLIETKKTIIDANKNQNYPHELILEENGIQGNLDSILLLENIQDIGIIETIGINLQFAFQRTEHELKLNLKYDRNRYLDVTIEKIVKLLEFSLAVGIENSDESIAKLSLVSKEEGNFLLHTSFGERIEYAYENILDRLLVNADSDLQAIILNEQSWSYEEIHKKSEQLAFYLREVGVSNNVVVGIILEPSVDFVISVLAVLKSNGCFIPIDTSLPKKRMRFIISDGNAEVIITNSQVIIENQDILQEIESDKILNISNEMIFDHGRLDRSSISVSVNDLAYIIYTSGSTGNPKGVLVNHQNLNNYISWAADEYVKKEQLTMPLFTSVSFDLTITSLFLPLISGGTLHVYQSDEKEIILDKILEEDQVDIIKLTPSHLKIVKEREKLPSRLKTLIVGGEILLNSIAEEVYQKGRNRLEIYNEYGPTEATVGCTIYKYTSNQKYGKSVLIGKAAPNCQLLILDKDLNFVPFGVEGEIYIGGKQITSGYINKEITQEKFIKNPFSNGIMYKTGDIGKIYEDGNIEYIRRIDLQVKLNGYRIELREIELILNQLSEIIESKVVMFSNKSEGKYLGVYYISKAIVSHSFIKDYLLEYLPTYMIPLYSMRLDKFPLNLNGKLDEGKLPPFHMETQFETVLANNENERMLTEVMASVLGVERVGMLDNFFEKGGDSIKIIQLVARVLKYGYKLNIRDVYDHPKPSELVNFLIPITAIVDQGMTEGETTLNPIQKWFHENFQLKEHYNQSVMLHCVDEIDLSDIKSIFGLLLEHHDALRMTIGYKEGQPILINGKVDQENIVKFVDLRSADNENELLEDQANSIQSSISLEDGPLIKVGVFRLNDGDRLLIVVHHMVIDGISWRILLEDFATLHQQIKEGKKIELPLKTHSFLDWNNALRKYASLDSNIEKELSYWRSLPIDGLNNIPHDCETEESVLEDRSSYSFSLSPYHTNEVLRNINWVYHTEINDILMTGLMLSIQSVFKLDKLAINLEGHGREEILYDIEISRTIGWFTSLFPVILDISQCQGMSGQLKAIKEQLHTIPSKGIGYGIIKYLSSTNKYPIFQIEPSLSFNYLGSFDDTVDNDYFRIAMEKGGNNINLKNRMVHDLEIQGSHVNEQIHITINYNKKRFKRETIEKFGKSYHSSLSDIIDHCKKVTIQVPTPSDFTYNKLSIDHIDHLNNEYSPEDIYPLTPMQKGLYFHAVSNPDSFAYNTQFGFTLKGNLDVKRMKECFNLLLRRYQILRANFLMMEGHSSPIQLIAKNKEIDFHFENLSSREDREEFLAIAKEKLLKKTYDLSNDVLMRVAIYKMNDSEYKVLWYYHHILLDGWCLNILFKDILAIYNQLLHNQVVDLQVAYPYKNYIRWLQNTNYDNSKEYWGRYLNGFKEPSILLRTIEPTNFEEKSDASVFCHIGVETVSILENIASKVGCTMYTIIETLWSILLAKCSEKNDLVYGQVVSGRPNIEGSSEMVGLFINTIPKRVIINESQSFIDLLKQILHDDIESLDHHTYPLSDLIKTTILGKDLFDHVIVFENQYQLMEVGSEMSLADFDIIETESYDPNEYNLSIFIHHTNGQLSFEIRFNEQSYSKKDIIEVSNSLQSITKKIVSDQNQSINDILLSLIDEELEFTQIKFT